MLEPLKNKSYCHLFSAQVIALLGTGLTTVALALLAYDLAGDKAGTVLGTALALKMVAYVTIAPIVSGLAASLPRKKVLVTLDFIRAAFVFLKTDVNLFARCHSIRKNGFFPPHFCEASVRQRAPARKNVTD